MTADSIPRYDRKFEPVAPVVIDHVIPDADLDAALAESALSPGTQNVIRAIARLARPALFPGGGVGLEYGALLKTVARPDLLARHIVEAAAHLRDCRTDLLVVPGMSGYPIGAMYSHASGIPALLLKKQSLESAAVSDLAPGSFIIPSYTGNADTVISADVAGARDILREVVRRQLTSSRIEIRIAGADEIIDKATMATAITENIPVFVRSVVADLLAELQPRSTDHQIQVECTVVAWVTPLLKGYGTSESVLERKFGIVPFAGATVTAIQIDPPAIGFEGLGLLLLENDR